MVTSNPLLKREESFTGTADSVMNLNGTVNKTGILLLICIAMAAFAWCTPEMQGPIILLPVIGGLVLSLVGIFKPTTTPIVAPCYAAMEGWVLGAISVMYNVRYPGLPATAVVLTFSVLGLFLVLYATRIVQVTNGMRVAIIAATGGICVVYVIAMLLSFFHVNVPFVFGSGTLGIVFSLVVCGIAAFNFFLDFNAIESYIRAGAPKYMEWYSGMALMITLVWLYLEILRLLSKLQSRR
jgi:uncharacterized YccA/Bax inhibitor family protein